MLTLKAFKDNKDPPREKNLLRNGHFNALTATDILVEKI